MQRKVLKAVFPVAGLGTRFLPATKSIPKEIMTLVDRPLIQYAIDEAREAGIEKFIFVTARGKGALENYLDCMPDLEDTLEQSGKTDLLETLRDTNMTSGAATYVRQDRPLGLGHAVWCAHRLIGDEPFAVLLPDDVISGRTGCLKQMVEAYQETGGNMVATMEVPPQQTSSYGVLDVAEDMGRLTTVRGLVEKPAPGTAPSNLAVIGRYLLAPSVMRTLGSTERGTGGESQLTAAIARGARPEGTGVYGYRFEGERFDCGSKAGFLQATLSFGMARDDLRPALEGYMERMMYARKAAE